MHTLTRLERLRNRRLDPNIRVGGLNEVYGRLPGEDSAVQYAIGAMQPIDPDYTARTIEERNRVEKQLSDGYARMGLEVDFNYQGSVTNDTHIRAHSDVDLLTIETRFVSVASADIFTVYQGDAVGCLRQLRRSASAILRAAYPAAKIDESGSKAINLSGGSLRRKIDVIASNWWHTAEYLRDRQKYSVGVEVLDNNAGTRIPNKPFLHNKRIADKDAATNGGLRKAIRLLKSLKYDSDEAIEMSSYDIAGVVFRMDDKELFSHPGHDLVLAHKCDIWLHYLELIPAARENLLVPNEMRKIFCAGGASEKGLRQMRMAVGALMKEIEEGLSRSFRKLAEARIKY